MPSDQEPLLTDSPPASPRWNTSTKFLIWLVLVVMLGALAVRFRELIAPLLFAGILAYILNPVVRGLSARTRLPWGVAVGLVYLVIIVLLLAILTAAGFAIREQIIGLSRSIIEITSDLPARVEAFLQQPIHFGPFTLDFSTTELKPLYDQIVEAIRPALSQTGTVIGSLASETASVVGWLLFILIISFYLLHDLNHLMPSLEKLVPQGYLYDARRLTSELGPIWNAFLRGQITISIILGVLVGLSLTVLGVRYAPVLGLLAILMEFIPIAGPLISTVVGTSVAFFQPGNWLGLSPIWYAGVVLVVYAVLQQIQNNVIIPRILGRSLHLHPIIILVGAIVAASLAGVVGLLLSAPTIATLRLFGRYVYCKLFDLDPWPPAPPETEPPPKKKSGEASES